MYKIKTFLLFMTSSYCSLLKVCFFSQWNFIEVSLTAAPNWDNNNKKILWPYVVFRPTELF